MAGLNLLKILIEDRVTLVNLARRIVGSQHDAEDVLQDVAVKTYRTEAAIIVGNAQSYLRRMVVNQAVDHRRRTRLDFMLAAPTLCLENIVEDGVCPHAQLEARETLRAVAGSIQAMPSRARHAFLAHRLGGESQKAIAARIRVSPTLVNFLIRDATAQCREAAARSAA